MWNPEARDASPIVCTFMSSWKRPKMPPLPGRRGTRRSWWKRAAAGLDEVGGSSCGTITSVRIPLPHFFAWTLDAGDGAGAGAVGLAVEQSLR